MRELEKKILGTCILEPRNIEKITNLLELNVFSEEPRKIFEIMQDNFKKGTVFELDDLDVYSKQYIDLTIEKEFTSVNFDKYLNQFYELTKKDKLKKALKDFKEDDFNTIKNKLNVVFSESTNILKVKKQI